MLYSLALMRGRAADAHTHTHRQILMRRERDEQKTEPIVKRMEMKETTKERRAATTTTQQYQQRQPSPPACRSSGSSGKRKKQIEFGIVKTNHTQQIRAPRTVTQVTNCVFGFVVRARARM